MTATVTAALAPLRARKGQRRENHLEGEHGGFRVRQESMAHE